MGNGGSPSSSRSQGKSHWKVTFSQTVTKVSRQVMQISGLRALRQRKSKCSQIALVLTRDRQEARRAAAE